MQQKSGHPRNRIKEFREVKASELVHNPRNPRRHPAAQMEALKAVLDEVGNIDVLKAVETDKGLMLIDGHARADVLADEVVTVAVLDLDEAEQLKALATFDPIRAMAEADGDALAALLADAQFDHDALANLAADVEADVKAMQAVPFGSLADLTEYGEPETAEISIRVPRAETERVKAVLDGIAADAPKDAPNARGWAMLKLVELYESSSRAD